MPGKTVLGCSNLSSVASPSAHVYVDISLALVLALALAHGIYQFALSTLSARLFAIAVLVNDFALNFTFSCKAAPFLFVFCTNTYADIHALSDFFDDLVDVDGASTVVVVDYFLSAAVGC